MSQSLVVMNRSTGISIFITYSANLIVLQRDDDAKKY